MSKAAASPQAARVSRSLLRGLASGHGPDRVLSLLTDHVLEDLEATGAVVHAVRHGHLVTRASAGTVGAETVDGGEIVSRPLLGPGGVVGTLTAVFPNAPSAAVEAGLDLFAGVAEVALALAGRGEEGRGRRLSFAATLRKVTRVASGSDARPSLQALVEDAARLAGAMSLLVLERVEDGFVVVAGAGVPLDVLRADVMPAGSVVPPEKARGETGPFVYRAKDPVPPVVDLVDGRVAMIAFPSGHSDAGATVWRWAGGSEPDDTDVTVAGALSDVIGLGLARGAGRGDAEERGVAPAAFLAMLSHELRTPLAVIKGAVETLQAHGEQLGTGMRARLVDQIRHRVDQEIELVESLLSLSRLDEGRFQLVREPFDLVQVASGVADDHREVFGRQLEVSGPDEAPIVADRVAVRQVLANLVVNALKFSSGTVWITVSRRPRAWRVHVDDDGEGVPRDLRARIFERFVRGEDGATTPRGVGVGLAVVRGFVELHGGRVGIAGSPQGGARFWFELPDA